MDANGWEQLTATLLGWATEDLVRHGLPRPTLVGFVGDEPLGAVGLRPFGPGEVLQPLLEVLALLLPMGVDRLGVALPGRAWSTADPIPPVCEGVDLRARVLIVALADGRAHPCRVTTSVHPFDADGDGFVWHEPLQPDEPPASPAIAAMATLLDARDELTADVASGDRRVHEQLGRVLLLGHEVAFAPAAAARLAATTRA